MADEWIPDLNVFMACSALRRAALTEMPAPYGLRSMRPDEYGIWKAMPFDDSETAAAYDGYMDEWWQRVYASRAAEFFERTLFAVDEDDRPVGTCLMWEAYGRIPSIHWLKVVPQHEGRGVGRALLSAVLRDLDPARYPVYLHTQPGSLRAIRLYTDFGFDLLSGERIGTRPNELVAALPFLRRHMPAEAFASLTIVEPQQNFVEFMAATETADF